MTAWDTIRHTIVAEFSDLGDLEQVTQLVVRWCWRPCSRAARLQRERQGKDAGIRTLVAASSA